VSQRETARNFKSELTDKAINNYASCAIFGAVYFTLKSLTKQPFFPKEQKPGILIER
jgi:hypothetical protein